MDVSFLPFIGISISLLLSLYLSIYLSLYLSIYPSIIYLYSICLSIIFPVTCLFLISPGPAWVLPSLGPAWQTVGSTHRPELHVTPPAQQDRGPPAGSTRRWAQPVGLLVGPEGNSWPPSFSLYVFPLSLSFSKRTTPRLSLSLSLFLAVMSSRRRGRARISEEEMNELITKLQSLLPESRRHNTGRVGSFSP